MSKDNEMRYWLMKSEPADYSIDDLQRDHNTSWDGVRNYQARNFMRDKMSVGDQAFFYHSNTDPGIYGMMKVASKPYPDPTQFDKSNSHFDPKATKESPRWFLVDVRFIRKFKKPVTLPMLKKDARFRDMMVTQKGTRLSIQPVSKKHFEAIVAIGNGNR